MRLVTRTVALVALALAIAPGVALAKIPAGWPFLEFNDAVRLARQQRKPMFVYFGFETCPYCAYLNEHALASASLRKRFAANYVLAYFDIRANPEDDILLPAGGIMPRAQAMRHFRGSAVPAWMFVDPAGRPVLYGRGSRTSVNEFWQYDLYVAGGAYKDGTYEQFLARRGLRSENPH